MARYRNDRSIIRWRPAGGGSTLLGVLLGLILGAAIALGIAWYVTRATMPFSDKPAKPASEANEAQPTRNIEPQAAAAPPTPGKTGEKASDQPRFDFYNMLPGATTSTAKQPSTAREAPGPSEPVFLQAGSFRKANDADNLKARIAFIGLEANVQTTELPGKGIVHRVRLGPFAKASDMNRARAALAESGIQTALIKGNEAAAGN